MLLSDPLCEDGEKYLYFQKLYQYKIGTVISVEI
ncbi:MAG: hypothetical protein ACI8RD_005396 [Bacillariaceae sp.]|jgi:hypothetical protein